MAQKDARKVLDKMEMTMELLKQYTIISVSAAFPMHIQFQLAQQCIQISTRINSSLKWLL